MLVPICMFEVDQVVDVVQQNSHLKFTFLDVFCSKVLLDLWVLFFLVGFQYGRSHGRSYHDLSSTDLNSDFPEM